MASEYENKIEVGTVVYEWCGDMRHRNGEVVLDTRWSRKLTVKKVAQTQFTTDDGRRWKYRRDYRDSNGYQAFGSRAYVHLAPLALRPIKTWDEHLAVRDLSDYRDATFETADGKSVGLMHGAALTLPDGDWFVVRCPYCRAAYGARISPGGYVGSAVDFCVNCDKMLPGA